MGKKIFVAALAALVLTAHSAVAEQLTMCVTHMGRTTMVGPTLKRQTCRTNETLVPFNTEGPQGIQGPPGDPGQQGPPGLQSPQLHIFDADDNDLGLFAGAFSTDLGISIFTIYLIETGDLLYLPELGGTFGPQIEGGVRYEGSNCTGLIFTDVGDAPLQLGVIYGHGISGFFYRLACQANDSKSGKPCRSHVYFHIHRHRFQSHIRN